RVARHRDRVLGGDWGGVSTALCDLAGRYWPDAYLPRPGPGRGGGGMAVGIGDGQPTHRHYRANYRAADHFYYRGRFCLYLWADQWAAYLKPAAPLCRTDSEPGICAG